MKTVVLINGSGGCGKSTFIKFCAMLNDKVVELSTIDYVKEIATKLGWDGSKTEESRRFLHNLKKALEEWKDIPNIKVVNAVEEDFEHKIFFINVREVENIKKLNNVFDFPPNSKVYTLLVKNSNVKEIKSNGADANVNNYKYDYIIDNSGTLGQLLDKANDFIKEVGNYND